MLDAHIHIADISESERVYFFENRQVSLFFNNAALPNDWDAAISSRVPGSVPFIGVHPWCAESVNDSVFSLLREHLLCGSCGVGEIGLDKGRIDVDYKRQCDVFALQMQVAYELDLPAVIHCVKAEADLLRILRGIGPRAPFMVHSYSGSFAGLKVLCDMGGYISFSPRQLLGDGKNCRILLPQVPLDRLLIESDYPFFPKRFEQKEYLKIISEQYGVAAALLNIDKKKLVEQVLSNGQVFANRITSGKR